MTTTDVRLGGNEDASKSPQVCANNNLLSAYCFIKNIVSASGTSAVAIDNKIEQAMDLVKSHLMFAVREEVEVLREKIAELMDRINLLELENSVLKSHATPDTLASLAAQVTAAPAVGVPSGPPPQPPPN